jgi:hypothetical protein
MVSAPIPVGKTIVSVPPVVDMAGNVMTAIALLLRDAL